MLGRSGDGDCGDQRVLLKKPLAGVMRRRVGEECVGGNWKVHTVVKMPMKANPSSSSDSISADGVSGKCAVARALRTVVRVRWKVSYSGFDESQKGKAPVSKNTLVTLGWKERGQDCLKAVTCEDYGDQGREDGRGKCQHHKELWLQHKTIWHAVSLGCQLQREYC